MDTTELRRLLKDGYPTPWERLPPDPEPADERLAVAAVNALPHLLAALDAAEKERDEWQEMQHETARAKEAAEKALATERERCAKLVETHPEHWNLRMVLAATLRRPPSIAATEADDLECPACHESPMDTVCACCGYGEVAIAVECSNLRAELATANREAERLRHGAGVEGDYVCPAALERDALRVELAQAKAASAEYIERTDRHQDALAAWLAKVTAERDGQKVLLAIVAEDRATEFDAAQVIIRELRQKLAIAGVDGSQPPGEDTTIGQWSKRAHDAESSLAAANAREAGLWAALDSAAKSLHTASLWGTLGGYQGDLADMRAWAGSRASVARAALSEPSPGWVALSPEDTEKVREALERIRRHASLTSDKDINAALALLAPVTK